MCRGFGVAAGVEPPALFFCDRVGFSSRIPIVRSPYNAATNDQDRLDLHNVPQNSRMMTVGKKHTQTVGAPATVYLYLPSSVAPFASSDAVGVSRDRRRDLLVQSRDAAFFSGLATHRKVRGGTRYLGLVGP